MYRRIARMTVRHTLNPEAVMPRIRSEESAAAIAASPKYRISTTLQIPQDFLGRITELCRLTGLRKYEIFIAGTYALLRKYDLHEEDTTLAVYLDYFDKLIQHARDCDKFTHPALDDYAPQDDD